MSQNNPAKICQNPWETVSTAQCGWRCIAFIKELQQTSYAVYSPQKWAGCQAGNWWDELLSAEFLSVCVCQCSGPEVQNQARECVCCSGRECELHQNYFHHYYDCWSYQALLPCSVSVAPSFVQWTKDGFGLGVERGLPGYPRYSMVGTSATCESMVMW